MASLPTAVHPFPESKNLVVVLIAQTDRRAEQANCVLPKPDSHFAFAPTTGNRSKNGTIRLARSESRLTSQYQPPFPACRSVPQPESLPKEIQRLAILLRDVEGR